MDIDESPLEIVQQSCCTVLVSNSYSIQKYHTIIQLLFLFVFTLSAAKINCFYLGILRPLILSEVLYKQVIHLYCRNTFC